MSTQTNNSASHATWFVGASYDGNPSRCYVCCSKTLYCISQEITQ